MTSEILTSFLSSGLTQATFLTLALVILIRILIPKDDYLPSIQPLPIVGHLGYLRIILWNRGGQHNIKPIIIVLQLMCGLAHIMADQKLAYFRIVTKPFVLLFKPESVEVILSSKVLIEKHNDYKYFHSWLGTGLLTSHGEKWHVRRKLLTPTFHYQILEDFFPIINEQSSILVENLKKKMKDEVPFDVVPMVTHCALDIICETALGVKVRAQEDSNSLYAHSVKTVSDIILSRMIKPWLWNETIFGMTTTGKTYFRSLKILHDFTKNAINKRKTEMLQNKMKEDNVGRRKAFLDLLLHYHLTDPNTLTENDIREEVDTFTFEGHDTTAMGISWALYLIGLNPEVQKKVQQELESICGSKSDLTLDDLKEMKYLECVLKESQRLYPSVPIIGRQLKQPVDVCGYHLPKGSNCLVLTYFLHRNPEVFPDPERFDPERFTLENSSGRHPYAYVPFSAGPRNCIGQRFAVMEEKTVLAHVLRNFHVTSVDPRDRVHVQAELISRSSAGIRLQLRPR